MPEGGDSFADDAVVAEKKEKKRERAERKLHRRRRRDAAKQLAADAPWEDSDETARMQALVEEGDADSVQEWLERDPQAARPGRRAVLREQRDCAHRRPARLVGGRARGAREDRR